MELCEKPKLNRFEDNVAKNTAWNSMNTGASSSFNIQKLVCVNSFCIECRTTWMLYLFCGFFLITGLYLFSLFINDTTQQEGVLGGVFFIFCGLVPFYFSSIPIVFDKQSNYFLKGGKYYIFTDQIKIRLDEIYALQLIQYETGGEYNYLNCQRNLVNKESKRIHVCNYATKEKAKQDAEIFKFFLNCKLWDAT